jgi:hypothetical protein
LPFNFERDSVATRVNKQGLIETVGADQPRIDYLNDSNGALKLEPSRTNLITYSEDFSQSVWQKNSVGSASAPIIASNFAVSPDGTQNATRVQFNISGSTSSDRSSLESVFALDGSSSYTLSFYIKSNTGVNQNLSVWLNSVYGNNITVTNEWVRVEQTFSSNSTFNRGFGLAASGDIQQSVDVLIFGFQLEQGSYATSYIPTQGSAVTRLADSCNQTPPDGVIGQTEGSIFSEFKSLDDVANIMLWMRNPSGGIYGDMMKLECGGDARLRFEVRESNVTSTTLTSNVLPTNIYYKVAVAYKQNDFVMYLNGVQIGTDNTGNVPTCSEMYVGKYIDGGIRMGVSKDLKLYNTRLSNSELAALTQV